VNYKSLSFILPAVYTLLCLLALGYIAWRALVTPGQFELAGIAIFALGLPWSLIFAFAVLAIHSSSAWLLAIACLGSCVLNGWLLYRLGQRISSHRR